MIQIAIMGLGTVGTGVAKVWRRMPGRSNASWESLCR